MIEQLILRWIEVNMGVETRKSIEVFDESSYYMKNVLLVVKAYLQEICKGLISKPFV